MGLLMVQKLQFLTFDLGAFVLHSAVGVKDDALFTVLVFSFLY